MGYRANREKNSDEKILLVDRYGAQY